MNGFSTNKTTLLLDFRPLLLATRLLHASASHPPQYQLVTGVTGALDRYFIGVSHRPHEIDRVGRCEISKYIKSGLSCLFAYQFRQSIVWTMELAINTIWQGLARLFDGASPGLRAACFWVPVQCVGACGYIVSGTKDLRLPSSTHQIFIETKEALTLIKKTPTIKRSFNVKR